MSYRIAGIDVHKKMLAVAVSDVEVDSEFQFERRWFGSNPEQLRSLAAWLVEQQAEEVVICAYTTPGGGKRALQRCSSGDRSTLATVEFQQLACREHTLRIGSFYVSGPILDGGFN